MSRRVWEVWTTEDRWYQPLRGDWGVEPAHFCYAFRDKGAAKAMRQRLIDSHLEYGPLGYTIRHTQRGRGR